MTRVSLRENCIVGAVFTLLCTVFIVALSIKVGFKGWQQIVELSVVLILFNIFSCIYVVTVNRPTSFFYFREILICSLTAGIAFYIWIAITLLSNVAAFFTCLFVVAVLYGMAIYVYLKAQHDGDSRESSKNIRIIGVAGAFGASMQIIISDNGVLLLITTLASFVFSLMATFYLRLAIKKRWGKVHGSWNDI